MFLSRTGLYLYLSTLGSLILILDVGRGIFTKFTGLTNVLGVSFSIEGSTDLYRSEVDDNFDVSAYPFIHVYDVNVYF